DRFETCVTDPDIQPGIGCDVRVSGRVDVGCQPAEKRAARPTIFDPQKHVRAEVWRRPRPQHGRLYFVELERRHARRTILTIGFHCGQNGRILFLFRTETEPWPWEGRNAS